MRLWHYKLIPFLPKSQLLAQWRELNSIFKKQDKHVLINYVYDYPKIHLYDYSVRVVEEMIKRHIKIKSLENSKTYFGREIILERHIPHPFPNHHEIRYLEQCFYNLQEKYDRGQKDFSEAEYNALVDFFVTEGRKCLKPI